MKFILPILLLIFVSCAVTNRIDHYIFGQQLENARMETYTEYDLPPSGFDEKTMFLGEGDGASFKSGGTAEIEVRRFCVAVSDYPCTKIKTFSRDFFTRIKN